MVKNPPAMWETWVQSLDWEDPLEEGMASHSSILAWRILMDRSLAGYSPWIHKELDMTERLSTQHKPPYIESLSFSNTSLLSFLSQGFLCTCYSLLETVSLPFLKWVDSSYFLGSSNVIISERLSSTYKPFLPQTNKKTVFSFSPSYLFFYHIFPSGNIYVFVNLFPICLHHWNKCYVSIWTISIRFLAIWPASCTVLGLQLAPNMCQSLF